MQLIEVNNAATAKDFIRVNVLMNKNNPNYIRPLDNEVNDAFDPAKNKAFKCGEAKRWVLKNDNNNLIGQILFIQNVKLYRIQAGKPTYRSAHIQVSENRFAPVPAR